MAEKKTDCEISLKSSKKTITSVVCELIVPNFFTLPEYKNDASFEVDSPSFDFANATWQFRFVPDVKKIKRRTTKSFKLCMKRIYSEIPEHNILGRVNLLSADGEKYEIDCFEVYFDKDDIEDLLRVFNKDPSCDEYDTLILFIDLIYGQSLEAKADKVQQTTDRAVETCRSPITLPNVARHQSQSNQDFHHSMIKTATDSKITLKLSKKNISSVVCTLKVTNLAFLQKHENDTTFEVDSPSFDFANATWRFRIKSSFRKKQIRLCDVKMIRLCSEMPECNILGKITILAVNNKKHKYEQYFTGYLDNDENESFIAYINDKYLPHDNSDTSTVIIHLISEDGAEEVQLATDRDVKLLLQDFKKLLFNGKNHDLTLRVADKEFRVHQDVLMARSAVFESMLSHDMTERNKGVIDIPDCDPQAMEQFLVYVYSGKIDNFNQDTVLGLYYIADKYNMAFLKEDCADFIKKSLSPSIICDVIQLASNHSDEDLLGCATEYFINHTNDILPTLEWMSFLKSNATTANELLIKASKKWSCANK